MGLLHGSLKQTMDEFQRTKQSGKTCTEENAEIKTDPGKAEPQEEEPQEEPIPRTRPLAMFLAALIVVLPVVLLAAGLLLLAFWLFV